MTLRADEGEGEHRCIHVGAGDTELLLHGNAGASFRAGSPHALVYLDVEDLDRLVDRLRSSGVDVQETDDEHGRELTLRDPDGYPLCLREQQRRTFRGGRNIAMKVPPHLFDATERFYVETLGFPVVERRETSVAVAFGSNLLWLDRVPHATRAEVWLEVYTEDVDAAASHLEGHNVVRCDEVEPLPEGYPGFWITSPAQVVHLVTRS